MLAGRVTDVEGLPEVHERVLGKPVSVGETENKHLDAPVTDPVSLTLPPLEPRTAGVAVKEPTVGAGGPATVTVTGVAVTEVFLALAVKWKVRVSVVSPALAVTATVAEALPELQVTVFGSPETAGVEEKAQLVTPVTDADSVTEPPAWGSVGGVAVNEVITGAGGPATVTLTGVAFTVLDPTANILKV
jgi:hypothetical protein